jgi:hypothetical protein
LSRSKRPRSIVSVGHDAFLDIVANLVGILIILVVILGSQSSQVIEQIESTESSVALAESEQIEQIEAAARKASAAASDSDKLERAIALHDAQLDAYRQKRAQLMDIVAIARQAVEEHRNTLDTKLAESLKQRAEFEQGQAQLASLRSERSSIESQKAPTVAIEHLPTPMAKTVYHDEIHLQLKNNRISVVPIEVLLKEVAESARMSLRGSGEGQQSETAGPIRGWVAKHVLERRTGMATRGVQTQMVRSVQMLRIVFEPLNPNAGQSIEEVLSGRSEVDVELAGRDPGRTTVTTWVYPDSFASHRRLQEYLYHKGFATAARPLNQDDPIAASPGGDRSRAQ